MELHKISSTCAACGYHSSGCTPFKMGMCTLKCFFGYILGDLDIALAPTHKEFFITVSKLKMGDPDGR